MAGRVRDPAGRGVHYVVDGSDNATAANLFQEHGLSMYTFTGAQGACNRATSPGSLEAQGKDNINAFGKAANRGHS
jgi:hypothetical protein